MTIFPARGVGEAGRAGLQAQFTDVLFTQCKFQLTGRVDLAMAVYRDGIQVATVKREGDAWQFQFNDRSILSINDEVCFERILDQYAMLREIQRSDYEAVRRRNRANGLTRAINILTGDQP